MKWIESIYDIENGDVLFKNTDMDDNRKSFFMRIINQITTGISNLRRKKTGKHKIIGRDHTEFLLWDGTILETHSSVSGVGVRSMSFRKWIKREGSPKIEILRRPERMSVNQIVDVQREIKNDRGIPYALIPAIKEGFTSEVVEDILTQEELMDRGIFCSESTKKYSGYEPYTGMWPDELYDFLREKGYQPVYYGESSDLLK